jgi:hypothetical protein
VFYYTKLEVYCQWNSAFRPVSARRTQDAFQRAVKNNIFLNFAFLKEKNGKVAAAMPMEQDAALLVAAVRCSVIHSAYIFRIK